MTYLKRIFIYSIEIKAQLTSDIVLTMQWIVYVCVLGVPHLSLVS